MHLQPEPVAVIPPLPRFQHLADGRQLIPPFLAQQRQSYGVHESMLERACLISCALLPRRPGREMLELADALKDRAQFTEMDGRHGPRLKERVDRFRIRIGERVGRGEQVKRLCKLEDSPRFLERSCRFEPHAGEQCAGRFRAQAIAIAHVRHNRGDALLIRLQEVDKRDVFQEEVALLDLRADQQQTGDGHRVAQFCGDLERELNIGPDGVDRSKGQKLLAKPGLCRALQYGLPVATLVSMVEFLPGPGGIAGCVGVVICQFLVVCVVEHRVECAREGCRSFGDEKLAEAVVEEIPTVRVFLPEIVFGRAVEAPHRRLRGPLRYPV